MNIQQSKDYHKFTMIIGNRVLSEKKIKNIIADIKGGMNLLPYCPILVYINNSSKQTYEIIDGQHRFEVCKQLKEPVYFVECQEQLSLLQIARMNSRTDKWTNRNFLDCYVNLEIYDYIVLKDFMKKYHIVYSAAITFLMNGKISAGGTDSMEIFRNGEFKVNHLELAEKIVSLTFDIFDIYTFRHDRYLIGAVHELYDKGLCDWEVLKAKVKSATNEMDKQPSQKEYKFNIERVYNYGNKNRVAIF